MKAVRRAVMAVLLFSVLVLVGINLIVRDQSRKRDQQVTDIILKNEPDDEKEINAAIEYYRTQYLSADNPLEQGASRPARAQKICSVEKGMASGWIGEIKSISSLDDSSKAVVEIESSDNITYSNSDETSSDIGKFTSISSGSLIFTQLSSMKVGDIVEFFALFPKNSADCIYEADDDLRTSMTKPHFIVGLMYMTKFAKQPDIPAN